MKTTHSGIIETVKDKTVATIKGTGDVAEKTADTATKIVTTTVKDVAKIGGDVGTAATGLVAGAVKGTKELAVDVERATAAVAGGALKAVGKVGSAAVDTARKVVTKPITSDKIVREKPELAKAA